jgi:hypothetical protein
VAFVSGLSILILFLVATAGVGYYFSGVLLNVDNSVSYAVLVKAVDGNQVTLSRDSDTELAVVQGLWWDGAGLHATVDVRMYDGDPRTDRGVPFIPVTITGELGQMPAWYVPANTPTPSTT